MSTRGLFGFRKGETVKAVYNHFDSYVDGLGQDFADFLKLNSQKEISDFFDKIIIINPEKKPTLKQKEYCKMHGWYDGSVSEQNDDDWHCLLRYLQGPEEYTKAIRGNYKIYIQNEINFIKDSLFCEYAYIYNIDDDALEFYIGFQKKPQEDNPFGTQSDGHGYYPCKLATKIGPCKDLTATELVAKMKEAKE